MKIANVGFILGMILTPTCANAVTVLTVTNPSYEIKVPDLSPKDIRCLSDNVYHEARGEPRKGWAAVITVVLKRVNDKRWPNSICGVIYQPNQFSWTRHPKPMTNPAKLAEITNFILDAKKVGYFSSPVALVDHYHTKNIKPKWDKKMKFEKTVGFHKFFASN